MMDDARAEALIADFVEGTIDDDARHRLSEWVQRDDARRERFVEQVRVHLGLVALLRRDAGEQALRRAGLIAESFSVERQRRAMESARDLRPARRRPHRWLMPAAWAAGLLACAGLALGIAVQHPAIGAPRVVGRIGAGDGQATIIRAGHVVPAAGSAVLAGDIVATGAGGHAAIGFDDDDSTIAVRAGSRLEALGPPGKRFRLLDGTMAVTAAPQPVGQPMVIATPHAEATVLGTAFTVSSNQLMTWLDVSHGVVRFGAPGDRDHERIGAGQRALATDRVRVVRPDRGSGLLGSYHDGDDFGRLALVRIDPAIDFDWKDRAPAAGVERACFSVRWTGELDPLYSEEYLFHIVSDDGVRLWIDGSLVIDNWRLQSADDHSSSRGRIALTAHRRASIRLDYFEHERLASVRLSWESPSQRREVVPQVRLYPGPP